MSTNEIPIRNSKSAVRNDSAAGLLLWLALTAMLLGCSKQKDYSLAPISGTVTLDGQPLAGAVVNFQPRAQGGTTAGPGSVARTNDAGRYTLATIRDEPGAVVGVHLVRIYSSSPESLPSSDDTAQAPPERVPQRYNYRTQLTYEVRPDGSGSADFSLSTDEEQVEF